MTSNARNRTRVVLHVDLDAFYCQVEMKRVGIPPHIPCAVQQWEGLIAVNYPARAAGITRHMRRAEAKAKCPELQCVHVETIGGEAGTNSDSTTWEDRKTQKACLERYRVASAEIIAVFHEVAPEAVVEKASIDEAYIDVTSIVDAHLQGSGATSSGSLPDLSSPECGNHVIGSNLDLDSEFERRLAVGAQLACHLRAAVKEKLGFTCSAGVACNKLLAKLASAMHKPSQQTVIPPRAVPNLMTDLPLKKIRNFGGKLGAELQALGCTTAGDVLALPAAKLQQNFGERASWIMYTLQGNSDEPVQEKERPKSMLAAKSFEPTSDMAEVERWVGILAEELADRMIADNKQFNRRPRSLHLQYRGGKGGFGSGDRSKSCPMPRFLKAGPTAPTIAEAVMRLFQKCGDAIPCTRLAVSASDFEDGPLSEGQGSITKFFGAGGPAVASASAASSAQPVAQPSRTSQTLHKPRTKQAAVALMFKGAKPTGASATSAATHSHSLQTGAAATHSSPLYKDAASNAQQPQHLQRDVVTAAEDTAAAEVAAMACDGADARQAEGSCDATAEACNSLQQAEADGHSNAAPVEAIVNEARAAVEIKQPGAAGGAQDMQDEGIGGLDGVDLAEQRQILHDLWLQRNASLTKPALKRPAVGGGKTGNKRTKSASGKQSQISGLLKKS